MLINFSPVSIRMSKRFGKIEKYKDVRVLCSEPAALNNKKTIEETAAMKWLKSKSGSGTHYAGISGITSNYEASQRHILTARAKGEFVEAMWNMVDRTGSDAERQQRDIRPREISRSEDQVKERSKLFKALSTCFISRCLNHRPACL